MRKKPNAENLGEILNRAIVRAMQSRASEPTVPAYEAPWLDIWTSVECLVAAGKSVGQSQADLVQICRSGAVRSRCREVMGWRLIPASSWDSAHIDLDRGRVDFGTGTY